jgi:two-component system phosphate regulon response regulator OmpR
MKNLLVVDDNENIRVILKQMLEDGGYTVRTAKSGAEALETMKTLNFDMVITDINMPEMTGFELLGKIKKACPNVPVIFITAYRKDRNLVDSVKIGLSDYIEKPFKMDEVLRIVKEHIA